MPPTAPPTTAVLCFSFLQVSLSDVSFAPRSDGESVATEDVEVKDAIAVWIEKAPMDVVVILGAVELLQQLRRSLIALQQYVPKSHVCMFHADTALSPSKPLFSTVTLIGCSSTTRERYDGQTHYQGTVVDIQ